MREREEAEDEVLAVVGVELPVTFTSTVEQLGSQFVFLGALAGLVVLATAYSLVQQRVQLPIRRLVETDLPILGPLEVLARDGHGEE